MRWFIAACIVGFFASPLMAQPVADRLPASTLVYVGWTPGDALKDTLPAKLLADKPLTFAWRSLLQYAVLNADQDDDQDQLPPEQQLERVKELDQQALLIGEAIKSPGCVAVLNLQMQKQFIAPEVVCIVDLGDRRKDFEDDFKPLQDGIKEKLGDRLHLMKLENSWVWLETNFREKPIAAWGFIGDSFIYYRGANAESLLPTLLPGKQPAPLKDDAAFTDALAKLPGDALLTTYCKAQPLLHLVEDGVLNGGSLDELGLVTKWPQVMTELGLDNAKSLVEKTTLVEGQFITRSLLRTDGPPHGLISTLIGGSVDDSLLKCAPDDSSYVLAGRLDLVKLYDQIKASSVEVGGDEVKKQIEQAEQAASDAQLPLKDALSPLGDQWLIYNASSTGGWTIFGTTLVGIVKDEKQIDHTIDVLTQLLVKNSDESGQVTVRSRTVDGVKISYLSSEGGFNIFAPSWAICDGRIFIALYPQMVEDAIAQAKAGNKSVLDDAAFAAARQRVGDGPLFYFSGPRFLTSIYPLEPIVAVMAGRELSRDNPDGFDFIGCIPSLRQALTLVGDDAAAVKVTPDGILKTQTQANPLVSALSLDSPAIWLAAAAPLMGDAEQENLKLSAARIRELGQGCMAWANDNKTILPPDLGTMVLDESINVQSVLSADSETTVPADFAQKAKEEQIAWINEHTDFVYLGGGEHLPGITAVDVLAYERPEVHGGAGEHILFGDGHVEWQTKEGLDKALELSKKAAEDRKNQPAPAAPKPDDAPPAPNGG